LKDSSYLFDFGKEGARIAQHYGVEGSIHVNDWVFQYIYHLNQKNAAKTLDVYLQSGAASAAKLRDLVSEIQGAKVVDGKVAPPMSILDFASGYGCVARHIRNAFAQANLVAMDIHENAIYFNQNNLGIQGAVSNVNPSLVDPFFKFDVVFSLSFFSHLPRKMIFPWLEKLSLFVKTGGILIFTTHGKVTHLNHLAHLVVDSEGYAFEKTSEQKDLSLDDYGNAVTYPKFIVRECEKLANMELVYFKQAAWWTHQDVFVLRRLRDERGASDVHKVS
jgi:SAM-dependent methyltransferase